MLDDVVQMRKSQSWILVCILLLTAGCLLVYLNGALHNRFVHGDDDRLIVQNHLIKEVSWNNVKKMFTTFDVEFYPIPLTHLTFAIEHHFWRLDPRPYHINNLILHIADTILVFFLLLALARRLIPSFVGGLLFAVHPLHVESVAWVSERKDVLVALFFFLCLLFYLKYLRGKGRRWYFISFSMFVLALLSKPIAVVLPAVLFLFDWFEGRRVTRRTILEKTPHFVLAIVISAVTLYYQLFFGVREAKVFKPFENVLTMCRAFIFYLQKTVWPSRLAFTHFFSKPITVSNPEYLISVLLSLLVVTAVIISLRRTRKVLFGFLFFLFSIGPVLQWIPVGNYPVSERYMYIPSFGLFYLAGIGFDKVWLYLRRLGKRQVAIALWGSLAVAVSLYSLVALRAVSYWGDAVALWKQAVRIHPESSRNWVNLAMARYRVGGYRRQVIDDLRRAVELDPENVIALADLGAMLYEDGFAQEAIPYLERAVKLDKGDELDAVGCLGRAYLDAGRVEEAIEYLKRSLEITFSTISMPPAASRRRRANAELNLGEAYREIGSYEKAIEHLHRAMEDPDIAVRAKLALARTFERMGRLEEALSEFEKVRKEYRGSAFALKAAQEIERLRKKITENSSSHAAPPASGD